MYFWLCEKKPEKTSCFGDLQSALFMDTFRTGTKCPSKRDFRLIESQIKGGTNSRCLFYREVPM